ncbi:MAG TPA: hypothetical protein VKM54_10405, partial [Myxococcota bacterium]|nr:hypothetical protein [Myxococcota bacterium]
VRWARRGGGLALLGLGAALLLLRQRGPGPFDTVWAEDGTIFLQGAWADPSPRGWLRGYAGYLQLSSRLLASVAAGLPIAWAPTVLSTGAALAAATVALVSYRAAETYIPLRRDRAILALALLILPTAGIETANAAANIHWYLLYGLTWVALWRPVGLGEIVAGSVLAFLAAASDPFAVLAAPVLGWRLLRAARSADWAFAVALGAGALLQAAVILGDAGSRALNPLGTSPWILGRWYGFQVLEGAAFGVTLRETLCEVLGVAPTAALAVLLLAVLLAPAARAARGFAVAAIALGGLHFGFYFLPVALSGVSTSRYTVTPIMLLYALIAWGLAYGDPVRTRLTRTLAVGILALISALDFAPWNARAEGPRWSEGLSTARTRCNQTGSGTAAVQISPLPHSRLAQGWSVEVPCRKLAAENVP